MPRCLPRLQRPLLITCFWSGKKGERPMAQEYQPRTQRETAIARALSAPLKVSPPNMELVDFLIHEHATEHQGHEAYPYPDPPLTTEELDALLQSYSDNIRRAEDSLLD